MSEFYTQNCVSPAITTLDALGSASASMAAHGFLLACLALCVLVPPSSVHGFVAAAPRPVRTGAALRAAPPQALVEDSGTLLALVEVAPPSFNLALGSLALGSVFGVPGSPLKNRVTAFVPGALLALFGAFLVFQTATLRFTFDEKEFSLVKADLSSTGENVVVGGENRWAYDKFVNYDFFPSESLPILVYFKETHRPAPSPPPSPAPSTAHSRHPRARPPRVCHC